MASRLLLNCVVVLFVISCALAEGQVENERFKRADDHDPLVPVVEQLSQQVQQLQAKMQIVDDIKNTVGFTVRMSTTHVTGLSVHQTVKFDRVLFNAGNGYSTATGLFTTPLPGTYVLSLKTMRHVNDGSAVYLDVFKNGARLARAYAGYSTNESGSSGLYLVHLNKGDLISVEVAGGSSFYGDVYTVFSGFRLLP